MPADQRLELGDEIGMGADRELCLGPFLEQSEVELLEPRDLLLCERLVADLGQRPASPHCTRRFAQRPPKRPLLRTTERDRLAALTSLQRTEDGEFDQCRKGCTTVAGGFRGAVSRPLGLDWSRLRPWRHALDGQSTP